MIQHRFSPDLRRSLFITVVVIIAFSGIPLAAERLAVIGKVANIRSGPGTKYDILCEAETFYPRSYHL